MFQNQQINEKLSSAYFMILSKYVLYTIFLLIVAPVYSQNSVIKEYKVEVIVFEHLELNTQEELTPHELDVSHTNLVALFDKKKLELNLSGLKNSFDHEVTTELIPELYIEEADKILQNESDAINAGIPRLHTDNWFVKTNQLKILGNIYSRLDRHKEYKILHRFSWVQPALPENNTAYIHEQFNNDGLFIRLYQSRYLHLDLMGYINGNLLSASNHEELQKIKLQALSNSIPKNITSHEISITSEMKYSSMPLEFNKADVKEKSEQQPILKGMVEFLLSQDRRIFQNEVHYFDHPKIGIIVSVYDSSL